MTTQARHLRGTRRLRNSFQARDTRRSPMRATYPWSSIPTYSIASCRTGFRRCARGRRARHSLQWSGPYPLLREYNGQKSGLGYYNGQRRIQSRDYARMVDVSDEIIFTGSNPTADRQTRRLAASGKLRKIHSSIYTSNLTEPLESIGLRHALKIAGHLFPGAVLSGRTAKEMHASRAGQDGSRSGPGFVFLCHVKARRSVALPGVQISAINGAGPQPGDFPLLTLYAASTARALLDNLT